MIHFPGFLLEVADGFLSLCTPKTPHLVSNNAFFVFPLCGYAESPSNNMEYYTV